MAFTLIARPEAELDIGEQYLAYESKRVGLGHDFVLCVEEALDKLRRPPILRSNNVTLGKVDYIPHMFAYIRPETMPEG